MPRIRTIKPEFWSSPDTAQASPLARLTYIAMWTWADDYGRGTLNLKELEGFIFPNDDVAELAQGTSDTTQGSSAQFRDTVKEVVTVFGLNVYEVDRRTYYEIPSWDDHQRTERKAKKCNPTPDQGGYVTDQWIYGDARKCADVPTDKQGSSVHFRDSDKEVLGSSGIGKGKGTGKGTGKNTLGHPAGDRERTGTGDAQSVHDDECKTPTEDAPTAPAYPSEFEQWWGAYPKKVGKRRALKDWKQAVKRERAGEIIAATRRFAEYHAACGTEKRFIPNPSTWLNRDGWGDELPQARPIQAPAGPHTGVRRTDEQVLRALLSTPENATQDVVDGEIIHQRQIG